MVTESSGTDTRKSRLSARIILLAPEKISVMDRLVVSARLTLNDLAVATPCAVALTLPGASLTTLLLLRVVRRTSGPLPSTTLATTASATSTMALLTTASTFLVRPTEFFLRFGIEAFTRALSFGQFAGDTFRDVQ